MLTRCDLSSVSGRSSVDEAAASALTKVGGAGLAAAVMRLGRKAADALPNRRRHSVRHGTLSCMAEHAVRYWMCLRRLLGRAPRWRRGTWKCKAQGNRQSLEVPGGGRAARKRALGALGFRSYLIVLAPIVALELILGSHECLHMGVGPGLRGGGGRALWVAAMAPKSGCGGVARTLGRSPPRRARMWTRLGAADDCRCGRSRSRADPAPTCRRHAGPRTSAPPHRKTPVSPTPVQVRACEADSGHACRASGLRGRFPDLTSAPEIVDPQHAPRTSFEPAPNRVGP